MFVIKEGTPPEKVGEGTDPETLKTINSYLQKQGYVVRTADDDKAYLQSQLKEEVGRTVGQTYGEIEKAIQEATGIPKQNGEKATEYQKRALLEKLKAVTDLEAKIAEFEKRGVSGNEMAQQLKRDLDKRTQEFEEMNKQWNEKFIQKDNEVFNSNVNSRIDALKAEYKANADPTLNPEFLDDILQSRINKFLSENKPYNHEGIIAFRNPADNTTRTSKQNGAILTLKELLDPYMKGLVKEQRQQGGAGSGGQGGGSGGGQGGGDGQVYKDIKRPDTVKTQVQLLAYLKNELKMDDKKHDFNLAFNALKVGLPVR